MFINSFFEPVLSTLASYTTDILCIRVFTALSIIQSFMFMKSRLETINDTIQSLKSLGLEIPEQLLYEQLQEEEKH